MVIIINRWNGNNIIKLYSIAKEIINENSSDLKEAQALQTICKATHQQFVKISQHIIDNPTRALKYSEAGRVYSETLKRKCDQLLELMNAEESITPMEEQNEVIITDQ